MIKIKTERCTGCGNCVEVCPFHVLEIENGKTVAVNTKSCVGCGACMTVCPNNAIEIGE
jgi:NAD-dependent dihydropyrimidine dehydrogenase PreA subunit